MSRRTIAIFATILAVVGLVAYVRAKRRKPLGDEDLIRAAIADMARKTGEKDVGGVMEHVSDRYHGEAGGKDELRRYLTGYFITATFVTAFVTDVKVTLRVDRATVTLIALLARAEVPDAAALTPELLAGRHEIEARFEKEDGVWRVVAATRRDATPSWLK